jgi:FixJ family two-component response regulator
MLLVLAIFSLITPKKVMVVDDEEDIIASIQLTLQSQGYEAGGFASPERAVEEIRTRGDGYALVISDIRMPTMTGFELARLVREARPSMPIVFMTAFDINKFEFSQVFPSTSVVELITKPFTTAQLIDTVRKYIGITEQH